MSDDEVEVPCDARLGDDCPGSAHTFTPRVVELGRVGDVTVREVRRG